MLKKWSGYIFLILFAAFIWGYSLVDIVAPGREYSELENRYLATAPKFSLKSLLQNTYTLKVEEFTNDQFMLRDAWITLKSMCETALLKIENNGVVYGKDGYMFEKRLSYDENQLDKNTDSILAFAEKFPGNSIAVMLVPTSDILLADKVPFGLNNVDQLQIIKSVYAGLQEKNINTVDAYGALKDCGGDIFYRTDHHWTTRGAMAAYEAYAMERTSIATEDSHEPTEFRSIPAPHYVSDFYGTFYSKSKLFNAAPDTIAWYDVPIKSITINDEKKDGLYDRDKWRERDKYAAFLNGNNGVTVIESDCVLNRESNKRKVLLFKDSYGNSFAPFLCYSFSEITVVDLRYFTEVEKLMSSGDYDEILFLYGFESFTSETSLVNLKL